MMARHCLVIVMEQVSEYYSELSGEAKARYESKVRNSGITVDPYAIRDDCWVKEMDVANIPEVKWSDMFMYLICTPSPYTREEMKVCVMHMYMYACGYMCLCVRKCDLYRHGKG